MVRAMARARDTARAPKRLWICSAGTITRKNVFADLFRARGFASIVRLGLGLGLGLGLRDTAKAQKPMLIRSAGTKPPEQSRCHTGQYPTNQIALNFTRLKFARQSISGSWSYQETRYHSF